MIKLGITGGIGAGKSYICQLLRQQHIPIYDCDSHAKRLTLENDEIRAALTALLGSQLYEGGQLNKPLLASYLFACPDHAAQVNQVIHPVVRQDFSEWAARHHKHPLVALESAILLESDFYQSVDKVLLVYAPEEVCLARAMARDNATPEAIKKRMALQMSEEKKRQLAHFELCNDGMTAVEPQLQHILERLLPANRSQL